MSLLAHRTRLLTVMLLFAVVPLLLAGCGGDGGGGESESGAETAAAEDGTSQGEDGGQSGTASDAATVDMVELAFEPAEVAITAGGTIEATNSGATPHNLTIEQGPDPATPTSELAATEDVAAGESAQLTVDLDPGTYAMVCTIPGHREGGMVGTLTVQ